MYDVLLFELFFKVKLIMLLYYFCVFLNFSVMFFIIFCDVKLCVLLLVVIIVLICL